MGKTTKEKTPTDIGKSAMMAAFNPKGENEGMAAWLEIMTESARFVADRFQQDLETQQAILECRKPEDLLRLQSEFYRKALEQYTSEATRMAQLMSTATTQTLSDAKTAQARGYDDLPL
jgi:hypothetical protein